MYRNYDLLLNKVFKELDLIQEKYRNGAEMTEGDLRRLEMLSHSGASLCKINKFQKDEDIMPMNPSMNGSGNNSFMNSSYNNQYQSAYPTNQRDGMQHFMSRESYPNNSGFMPYYQEDRRW